MNVLLYFAAALCLCLAWLLPIHYRPWVTYTGELYAFFALFAVAATFFKQKIRLSKISLPLLLLACVPLVQLLLGHVFFFNIAMMGFLYVFAFWLAITLGFNLSLTPETREKTFRYVSYTFLTAGVLSGVIAICQWLNLDSVLPGMIDIHGNTRPFANFAQPNNMATFLLMALMACFYLHEKKDFSRRILALCTVPIVVGVALSQSRTSWVACLCILLYVMFQQYKHRIELRWYQSLICFLGFVALVFLLPQASQWIAHSADVDILESRNLAQRAGGDMSRLAIWQQMVHAIQAQPWLGYGWYQTSVAFVSISDTFTGPVWVRSAHNFVLDFILWNGLIVAVPFLAYFAYWGYRLIKQVNSLESVMGILMIGIFVIHAMLEFPQNYAYFLLPVGFILGIVQAQNQGVRPIDLSPWCMRVVFALSLIVLAVIYRDYDVMTSKLGQSFKYEHQPEKITNQTPIYLLTEFNHRINFIRLNPYSHVSDAELATLEQLVLSYPTKYHLIKYAKVLAFNGHTEAAMHQLQRLKVIQKMDMPYSELLAPTQK